MHLPNTYHHIVLGTGHVTTATEAASALCSTLRLQWLRNRASRAEGALLFLEKPYWLQLVGFCIVTEMYALPLGRRGAVLLSAAHWRGLPWTSVFSFS